MAILGHADLLVLHEAAISAGLVDQQEALVAGIDPRFTSQLHTASTPNARLVLTLSTLAEVNALADGTTPLIAWLKNALLLTAARAECGVFQEMLERCQAAASKLASPSVDALVSYVRKKSSDDIRGQLEELGFRSNLYVRRSISEEFERFRAAQEPLFVVVDRAGAGKTWFVAALAHELTTAGVPVVLIQGIQDHDIHPQASSAVDTGRARPPVAELIERAIAAKAASGAILPPLDEPACKQLWETLDGLAPEGGHLFVLIDAVNEFYGSREALRHSVEGFLGRVKHHRRLKFLLTVRYETWATGDHRLLDVFEGSTRLYRARPHDALHGSAPLNRGGSDTGAFSAEEFELAWQKYGAHYELRGRPVMRARGELQHPLHLSYFCQTFAGRDLGEFSDASFGDVLLLYVNEKRRRVAERVLERCKEAGVLPPGEPLHVLRQRISELGRDVILEFAWARYRRGSSSSVPIEEARALFRSFIHAKEDLRWILDADRGEAGGPLLLSCFLEERLLRIHDRDCKFATETYFEYCLGRYIGRIHLGAPDGRAIRSHVAAEAMRGKLARLLDGHRKGHPSLREALRFAALERETIDGEYLTILRAMAESSSDLHDTICRTIRELAVVRYAATGLAVAYRPLTIDAVRDTLRDSSRMQDLLGLAPLDGGPPLRSDSQIRLQQDYEVERLFRQVLDPIAEKGDYTSRFGLQGALEALAVVHPDPTLELVREWLSASHRFKHLMALEALSTFQSSGALDALSDELGRSLGEPANIRFWVLRAVAEAMVDAARRHGAVGAACRELEDRPGLESPLGPVLDGFPAVLEQTLEDPRIEAIERSMLFEKVVALRSSLLRLPDPADGALAIERTLCSPELSWATVSCLLALVAVRRQTATILRRLGGHRLARDVEAWRERFEAWLTSLDLSRRCGERWDQPDHAFPRRITARKLVLALEQRNDHPFAEPVEEDAPEIPGGLDVVFSPEFLTASLIEHTECKERIYAVLDELEAMAASSGRALNYKGAPRATEAQLSGIVKRHHQALHEPFYVETVKAVSATLDDRAVTGHPFTGLELRAGSWGAACRSAGALVRAAELALAGRSLVVAPNRPPGHLATNKICVFDNVAVAVRHAQSKRSGLRVFIFDCDAHHGLHLQNSFYDDADVFYCSVHLDGVHPGKGFATDLGSYRLTGDRNGLGATLNLPMLVSGSGRSATREGASSSDEYLERMRRHVLPALRRFAPDLVFIAGGVDSVKGEPFAHLDLELSTIRAVGASVRDATRAPIVVSLEGGYGLDHALPLGYRALVEGLLDGEGLPAAMTPDLSAWPVTRSVLAAVELREAPASIVCHSAKLIGSVEQVLSASCVPESLQVVDGPGRFGIGAGSVEISPARAVDDLGELLLAGQLVCTRPRADVVEVVTATRCLTPFCFSWTSPPQMLFRVTITGAIPFMEVLAAIHQALGALQVGLLGVTGYVRVPAGGLVEKRLCRSPSVALRGAAPPVDAKGVPHTLSPDVYADYFASTRYEAETTALVAAMVIRTGRWDNPVDEDKLRRRTTYQSPAARGNAPREIDIHAHFALSDWDPTSFGDGERLDAFQRRLRDEPLARTALVSHVEPQTKVSHALLGVTLLDWEAT